MADNKSGRDKQAHDTEKRQRKRDLAENIERMDEAAPPIDVTELGDIESKFEELSFPVTGAELVGEVGAYEVESVARNYTVEELIPETETELYDSPAAVSIEIQRPTVAAVMKQVLEASDTLSNSELRGSQRKAYERTFQELRQIDADDDDEGLQVIADWIIEKINSKEKLPSSRAVRREAATFCRSNGYEIRNDQWLGI